MRVDVLRGVAALGILLMNIQSFAMPDAAYTDPYAYGDLHGLNYVAWLVPHVLANERFITIFSMLFGAGIVLRERAGDDADESRRFARRQIALLAIGAIHAYLLWSGDILVSYAIVGLLVFPFRRASPRALLIVGTIAFGVGVAASTALPLLTLLLPAGERATAIASYAASPDAIAAELAAYRGPWPGQQSFRFAQALGAQAYVLPFYSLPCTGGLMLIGIGLARLGFFQGAWRRGAYRATIAVGLSVGAALAGVELWLDARVHQSPFWTTSVFARIADVAALFAALAYSGVVVLLTRDSPGVVGRSLANVGRMALSCYLGQTILCTFFFYDLGYFGHVDRAAQLGIVACVWTIELAFAAIWLRAFRHGPVEWFWRSVTYGAMQPMRLTRTTGSATNTRARSTRGS